MAHRSFLRIRCELMDSLPMVRAGEAAEILHTRALAWCAANDTHGFVPGVVPPRLTPRRPARRVAALVDQGLWEPIGGGWRVVDWKQDVRLGRSPIPLEVRHAVYARDDWRCVFCGSTNELQLDHIYPWSLGGSDDPGNLQTLCRPCNRWKGARVL